MTLNSHGVRVRCPHEGPYIRGQEVRVREMGRCGPAGGADRGGASS